MKRAGSTPSGSQRYRCTSKGVHCYTTTDAKASGVRDQKGNVKRPQKTPVFKRTLGKVERFVITSAQNATPVHVGFVKALEAYCRHNNAELLCIPLRYKNPTSRFTASQANEEVWAPEVTKYLWNTRKSLNKNLVVLGDIKVQPTAVSPLTGFEAITHGESAILGHTKLQMSTVPTPQSRMPKILTTTGACTVRNYTDSKAGKLGEFHHTLGAAVVEMQGKKFHLRQLNAKRDNGSFTDLNKSYGVDWTKSGVAYAPPAEALVFGDVHVDWTDPAVERATFGEGGIVDVLKPKRKFWHDLLDGYAVNPHHLGNPFNAIAKRMTGKHLVHAEVMRALEYVKAHTKAGEESIIVASNHDDFLRRWILSNDWRSDPGNARFYLETAMAMFDGTKMGLGGAEYPSPFAYWARKLLPGVKVLGGNESYAVSGIEMGMHGDRGPNGARGSRKNLRRIGVKSIVGHSHSPGIDEGCYQTGTSTRLRLEYNSGPSSWLNTHCVVYANGKRALLNIIEGEWRL